jgi:proteic killer suppression protein
MVRTFLTRLGEIALPREAINKLARAGNAARESKNGMGSARRAETRQRRERVRRFIAIEGVAQRKLSQLSIRISDQWRLCFRYEDGNVFDVEIVDYH